ANAFDRRAWQRGEKPKVQTRLLAGGVALVVVAATVFGVGALISYQQDREEKERKENAATSRRLTDPVEKPSPSPSAGKPSASPSARAKPEGGAEAARVEPRSPTPKAEVARGGPKSRFPTGPNFQTTTDVLLRNVVTGLCADVPGFGKGTEDGPVEQYRCTRSTKDNLLWDLVVNQPGAGPGGADLFTIRNAKDGFCMDVHAYGPPKMRTRVNEFYCRPGSGDNQMWYLERKGPGRFWIRNHKGGMCLEVAGEKGAGRQGADLLTYPCSMTDDHLWSFA
ncbi:RICIN domain-containing protein, partial [Actinomadura sp. CNU-125]|uniref:RICIN domain-containing protein n=1 Tax=Actinomadura sp. CNU-125 TaxID=1904961 RepID=UPI0021CC5611